MICTFQVVLSLLLCLIWLRRLLLLGGIHGESGTGILQLLFSLYLLLPAPAFAATCNLLSLALIVSVLLCDMMRLVII